MTPKTSRASGPPRLPESLSPANTTTTSKSRENKTSQHHCSDTKKTRRRSSASIFASVGALTPLTTLCRERRGVAVGAVRGIASHRRACNPAALVVGLVAATAPGPKQTVPMRSNFERRPEVVAFFAVSDDAGGRGATARAEAVGERGACVFLLSLFFLIEFVWILSLFVLRAYFSLGVAA
ncbi:hypothetical protein IWX48DRAFT_69615 [Phyllosticta citricarpa]